MRNSKKTQALADNCAKAHGFFCASYRGCSEEELIYVPLCSNSENNPHVPSFILITKEGVQFIQGMEYIDVLDGVRLRAFRRGREIYNSLYRKFQEKNFDCDEDNSEESEEYSIVVSQMIKPKPWIAAHILYDYLEVAARLEMKVCLYPNKERIDGNQNWIYHVELI
ncbi:MAG: hypothetical protein K6G92_06790 [Bacteroidaceae bacterium]|nr:hypothetical protein [Bacteroidaceae bacterium]